MNCDEACQKLNEAKGTIVDSNKQLVSEIQIRFKKEGPALDCVSDHETYLWMLAHAPFYVSAIHCNDGEQTWWAAAVDQEAYDKWEEHVEHQHHPYEEHEHYLVANAGLID